MAKKYANIKSEPVFLVRKITIWQPWEIAFDVRAQSLLSSKPSSSAEFQSIFRD
jgi:hypothetical protein